MKRPELSGDGVGGQDFSSWGDHGKSLSLPLRHLFLLLHLLPPLFLFLLVWNVGGRAKIKPSSRTLRPLWDESLMLQVTGQSQGGAWSLDEPGEQLNNLVLQCSDLLSCGKASPGLDDFLFQVNEASPQLKMFLKA